MLWKNNGILNLHLLNKNVLWLICYRSTDCGMKKQLDKNYLTAYSVLYPRNFLLFSPLNWRNGICIHLVYFQETHWTNINNHYTNVRVYIYIYIYKKQILKEKKTMKKWRCCRDKLLEKSTYISMFQREEMNYSQRQKHS